MAALENAPVHADHRVLPLRAAQPRVLFDAVKRMLGRAADDWNNYDVWGELEIRKAA